MVTQSETAIQLFRDKRYREAADLCEVILESEPTNIEATFLSGQISLLGKNWNSAKYFFESALCLDQTFAKGRLALAECLLKLGDKEAALCQYKAVLACAPNAYFPRLKIADILISLFRIEEAISHYQTVLSIQPGNIDCMIRLSNALRVSGDLRQAEIWLDNILAIQRNHPIAQWNKSLLQLLQGDFKKGFVNYEARWRVREYFLPNLKNPQWDGSDFKGKKILVLAEQGWGDQIQFSRYIALLADRGARVLFASPPRSGKLFARLDGANQVVEWDKSLPSYDYYVYLLSLPGLLKTELNSIPVNIPYLKADPQRSRLWRRKLGNEGSLKIGIAWRDDTELEKKHNNDGVGFALPEASFRNIAYSVFSKIPSIAGIRLIALPLSRPVDETDGQSSGCQIEWLDEPRDQDGVFADTMAIIDNLDLVIAPDSVYVHLAAAMGKPTWTLINQIADWRWLLDRDDSPWYPNMKLFRQTELGKWDDVMDRVTKQLKCLPNNAPCNI